MTEAAMSANSVEKKPGCFGPKLCHDERYEFRLVVSGKKSVSLTFSNDGLNWFTRKMSPIGDGEYYWSGDEIKSGARYWYILDETDGFPDPWSRYQPDGPHEASQLVSSEEFIWTDTEWRGHPWHEAVVYELHIGTFTPEGTFLAAIDRLFWLKMLGITVVQVMPVWTTPNGPGWGYDANYPFSVNAEYGAPDDFKSFVNEAHLLGIQVVLDVIYNHLGIEGNYLSEFDSYLLSQDHQSKWGASLNLDGPGCDPVREMVVSNALFWLRDFHLDGLRIDAPTEIKDGSPVHILEEMARTIKRNFPNERHIHLILENDHYVGRIGANCDASLFQASINTSGGECLVDFVTPDWACPSDSSINDLLKSIKGGVGFEFTCQFPLAPNVVDFIHSDRQILGVQNHDLIGNQKDPQRIWTKVDDRWNELLLAIMCLTPSVPMFFMGDEIACQQKFPFFCRFNDICESEVLAGRAREFEFPDHQYESVSPFSADTFETTKINWPEKLAVVDNRNFQLITNLLALRRRFIQPLASKSRITSSRFEQNATTQKVVWRYESGQSLCLEIGKKSFVDDCQPHSMLYRFSEGDFSAGWWIE